MSDQISTEHPTPNAYPCPPWCTSRPDCSWDSSTATGEPVRYHDFGEVNGTITPAASAGNAYFSVSIGASAAEALHPDGPTIEAPVLDMEAPGVRLTAAEARQVASMLLNAADKLDHIAAS
ncbi:MAG: DUF6907 domain-containing protein [Mycobacteriales bacterium]